ncbi:MAG: hypothetical protein V2I36_15830 [Desulfopila sp.]|jgi:chemotaxis protein CheY-P-specific phosphatase CheC|nr:hypothetical protein [Desulfopila sp.]
MKTQKKLDKILEAIREKTQEEVGALMGVNFRLSPLFNKLTNKEDFLDEQSGKKIVAKMDITGEVQGEGALLIGIKDGIRLGGTLIMLPSAELDEVVKTEKYTEETEDSYGEIANIIAGSYTKVFEEMYSKSCRFVRKEQSVVTPLKLEVSDTEPFPAQWYYWVKSGMMMESLQMGDLDMLIPAEPFGLELPVDDSESAQQSTPATEDEDSQYLGAEEKTTVEEDNTDTIPETDSSESEKSDPVEKSANPTSPQLSGKELQKQKKLVDEVLTTCRRTISEEVSALLGVEVKLSEPENKIVTKEDFFLEEAAGKQVLARMDVVDAAESESFLFVSLKDAIRIGSLLIMLPPAELESSVSEEEFSPDTEDAYGEIANIISGAYTSVFQEQYVEKLRFVKTDLEIVVPMKVDIESDDIIPLQRYYMGSSKMEIGGKACGKLCMLIPAALLKLDGIGRADEITETQASDVEQGGQSVAGSSPHISKDDALQQSSREKIKGAADILIIENSKNEAEKIQMQLKQIGIGANCISFADNINFHITSGLRLIVIVMEEVNEQAYGITIKVRSLSSAPIVAAGPAWTRSKVIKAVKYGVQDILLTPAVPEDIREKVEQNIVKLAA